MSTEQQQHWMRLLPIFIYTHTHILSLSLSLTHTQTQPWPARGPDVSHDLSRGSWPEANPAHVCAQKGVGIGSNDNRKVCADDSE